MTQHPQWLVVAESPGGTRDFGITVIHRDHVDGAWTVTEEELAAGRRIAVAGGDDWRPLTVALLRDVAAQNMAAQIDMPLSAANVSVMAAGPNSDERALGDAILHHLSETLR